MIIWSMISKTIKQKVRDPISLSLTLFTTPVFVVLIKLVFNNEQFNMMIPGLLVFSIIMMVFSTAIVVAREQHNQSFIRMRMTGHSMMLPGLAIFLVQLFEGFIALTITIISAEMTGFEIHNRSAIYGHSMLAVISMTGIGLLVASFSNNVTSAFLLSSSVMFLFLLFSGIIFAEPSIEAFTIFSQKIMAFDFLPSIHLKKIILHYSSKTVSGDVNYYHTIMLLALGMVYFISGLSAFIIHSNRPEVTTKYE